MKIFLGLIIAALAVGVSLLFCVLTLDRYLDGVVNTGRTKELKSARNIFIITVALIFIGFCGASYLVDPILGLNYGIWASSLYTLGFCAILAISLQHVVNEKRAYWNTRNQRFKRIFRIHQTVYWLLALITVLMAIIYAI